MKIGLVCPYDLFRGGGVQVLVKFLAQELTVRGHQVQLITPRPQGYKGVPPEGIIFIGKSTRWKTPISTSLDFGVSFDTAHLDEILLAENFDILHVHEPEVPILGAQIVAHSDCPVVATFHAMFPDTAVARTIEAFRIPYARSIFKKIVYLTAVSEPAASFVREWSGRNIEIIPNCIDLNLYQTPATFKKNKRVIAYVGRLEKRKGVKYLLEAFLLLTDVDPQATLVIAGDGPERNKLEDWVQEHSLGDRVTFLGYVSEAEKHNLLKRASVFAAPATFGESFGIVLLEAMAAKTPIVAGDNPGYASVMTGRGMLSLVNPKDVTEFSRRLHLMLNDQEMRSLWLEWAAEYVTQFDYKTVVNRYEKLYKQAISQTAKSRKLQAL